MLEILFIIFQFKEDLILRLMCLMSCTQGGLASQTYKFLKQIFLQVSFALPASTTFYKVTRITRKQTFRSLSVSYQKKDGRAWPRPSFFWYDTDFSEFDSADIIDYILKKSVSYRPSFFWYDNDKDLKVCDA